jgi:hypothetical protein
VAARLLHAHNDDGLGDLARAEVLLPVEADYQTIIDVDERGITPSIDPGRGVERETGFEPATFCLGSRHSAN